MRNLTFVRHKVKHYPHLWLKVKTRSSPTHADGVSHSENGHFGQEFDSSDKRQGPSITARPLKVLLLLNFPKQAGGYVKDKAANLFAMWNVWAVLDSSY